MGRQFPSPVLQAMSLKEKKKWHVKLVCISGSQQTPNSLDVSRVNITSCLMSYNKIQNLFLFIIIIIVKK